MSYKISAPQIQLFVFNLQPSTFFSSDIAGNQLQPSDWLWEIGNNIVAKTLKPIQEFKLEQLIDIKKQEYNCRMPLKREAQVTPPKDTNVKNFPYIELADNVCLINQESFLFKGFIYPIRMYNSYGIWLKLSCSKSENKPEKAMDIQVLRHLNPENCFLSAEKQGYLGQTLVITVRLTAEDARKEPQELKKIADECIKNFYIEIEDVDQPKFNRVDELSDSVFFQYGLSKHLPTSGSILVHLLRDQENNHQLLIYNENLYDLLFYRARIIKSFQEITSINNDLTSYAQDFLKKIDGLQLIRNGHKLNKKNLDRLNNELIKLPIEAQKYEKLQAMLNNFKNEIDVSISKYNELVKNISKKNENEHFLILEPFIHDIHENWFFYNEQIKEYFRFFTHGSSLIDKAISSIRGQVAIAQTKLESEGQEKESERDSNQAITIMAVGGGISVSGVLSSSYATVYSTPDKDGKSSAQNSIFCEAIILGLLGGFLMAIVIKLFFSTRLMKKLLQQ